MGGWLTQYPNHCTPRIDPVSRYVEIKYVVDKAVIYNWTCICKFLEDVCQTVTNCLYIYIYIIYIICVYIYTYIYTHTRRVIRYDCRGFNNLSYTLHLR